MTNKRNTKQALIASAILLSMCFTMLLGTTFAWFTDSATSAGNKIVAGTLDVDLLMWDGAAYQDIGDSKAPIFGKAGSAVAQNDNLDTLWEPGKTQVAYLAITNNGSLDLKYNVLIEVLDDADDKDLYKALKYAINAGPKDGTGAPAWTDGKTVNSGVQLDTEEVFLGKGETHYFTLSVHMNEEAGNEYQGGYVNFDIKVLATQAASEADSFDNQYDAGLVPDEDGAARKLDDGSYVFYYGEESAYYGRVRMLALPEDLGSEYVVPEEVTDLGGAFVGVDLDKLTIGKNVEYSYKSLEGATIDEVVISEGATTIPNRMFYKTNVENIVIPSTVTTIEQNAFAMTAGVKELVIPASVTTVEEAAFQHMADLATVTFEGNTAIQGYAFRGCANLRTVYLYGDDVTFIPSTLSGKNSCWFCNGESNNPNTSNIDFYVTNDTVKERVLVAMGAERNNTDVYVMGVVSTTAQLVDAIKNAPVGKTTTILLADGTYSEDINITLADMGVQGGDVIIKANVGANPVIAGTVTMGYFENRVGATQWNATVTFDGITFDHAADATHSLSVQNIKGLTLNNCTLIGDGEYGISAPGNNPTGNSLIQNCTFKNAGLQLAGNFATGLVIDGCVFEESCINVQGGNGVTIQNCEFNKTLTATNVGDSFYAIRSNSTPITVKNCEINVDSELAEVATAQTKWGILWNRGNTNWTVEDVVLTLTDAAEVQTELLVTKCTSTGVINTNNFTVN